MTKEGRYLRDVLTILREDEEINLERSSTKSAAAASFAPFLGIATAPAESSTISICSITKNAEIQALKQRVTILKEETERIQRRKQETLDSHGNLLNEYEYGLNSIQKLTDLSVAPDNVMNGNLSWKKSW